MTYWKLKGIRAERGLTQEKMSELVDMERATYTRKENGHAKFYVDEVNRILDVLDCKYEDIFLPQANVIGLHNDKGIH